MVLPSSESGRILNDGGRNIWISFEPVAPLCILHQFHANDNRRISLYAKPLFILFFLEPKDNTAMPEALSEVLSLSFDVPTNDISVPERTEIFPSLRVKLVNQEYTQKA